MSRQSGISIQTKPIKGLITEQTALSFGDEACTEIWDCILDDKGRATRRQGLKLEQDYLPHAILASGDQPAGTVYTEYNWENPGGNAESRLIVQQAGSLIFFYDATLSDSISKLAPLLQILDLIDYLAPSEDPLTATPGTYGCQYASGNNDLFIVNPLCNPISISFDKANNVVSFSQIIVRIRDFEGLSDGFTDTFRPTSDVASIKVSNPNFYYNILNNGWSQTDALTQWDAARTDLPSKADLPSFYRASNTDSFDPAFVTAKSPGNRLGLGGHFIFPLNDPNRTTALLNEGITGVTPLDPLDAFVPQVVGTAIGNATNPSYPPSNAFDNIQYNIANSTLVTYPTAFLSAGKNYGGTPIRVFKVKVYPRKFDTYRYPFANSLSHTGVNPLRVTLYGHSSAPNVTYNNGTVLATLNFDEKNNPSAPFINYPDGLTLNSSDTSTSYQYVWVKLERQTGLVFTDDFFYISEMYIYDNDATIISNLNFTSVAFYAGRVFYAANNKVVYSQIIQNKDQYGRCFQNNDPTNEELSDLLPSDGGVISIRDMGEIDRIVPTFQSLLIFAKNGIWRISGSSGGPFKADDYSVDRISNYGQESPNSYVNVMGTPAWWSYEGIQTIQYDPKYNSFSVQSLSHDTIESFIQDIPSTNRKYVKATYDIRKKIVFWLYSDDPTFNHLSPSYNKVLCMNTVTGAFYPWTLPSTTYKISGILSLTNILDRTRTMVKFTTIYPYPGFPTFRFLAYAEASNPSYYDWEPELVLNKVDYLSHFTTGYKIDGQGLRDFQVNYGLFFLEEDPGSSCFMQCVYDFTKNGDTGRWSVPQQCYNASTGASVRMCKLKLRGHGKSVQFRFKSESGKPFRIIGWSGFETSNASV